MAIVAQKKTRYIVGNVNLLRKHINNIIIVEVRVIGKKEQWLWVSHIVFL